MSTKSRARSALHMKAALLFLAILEAACDSELRAEPRIDLIVRSDLDQAQLSHVQVERLAEQSDDVVESRWFSLLPDCVDKREHGLFSLSLKRVGNPRVRLRVTGYGPSEAGDPGPVVVNRFDTEVPASSKALLVELSAACTLKVCGDEESCRPSTGECGPVELDTHYLALNKAPLALDCGQVIAEAPPGTAPPVGVDAGPDEVDAMSPLPDCTTGDGRCPEGCSATSDRDCRRGPGEGCDETASCRTDLLCVQGVCCTSSCGDACFRCDLPESAGRCTAIDYTRSDDKANCGGCGLSCGGDHVQTAACAEGQCSYECSDGWQDCDGEESTINGCETDVRADPQNCGRCGRSCGTETGFPYCARQNCATPRGVADLTQGYPVAAGSVVGQLVSIPAAGTVLGLGVLVRVTDAENPGSIVIGLAENLAGSPSKVLTQTGLLVPRDGSERSAGKFVWTHGEGAHVAIVPGEYWVVVTSTKPFQIMGSTTLRPIYREDNVGLTYFMSNDFYGEASPGMTLSLSVAVVEN